MHEYCERNNLRFGFLSMVGLVAIIVLFATLVRQDGAEWFLTQALPDWEIVLLWPALALAWCGIVTTELMRRRSSRPAAVLSRTVAKNRWQLTRMGSLFVLIGINTEAFSSLKQRIPSFHDFYLDPGLVWLDRLIFGTDPWRITHALVGPFGTWIIDQIYIAFFPVTTGLVMWIIVSNDAKFQLRAVLTAILISFLIGFVLATAFASSGPVFYNLHYHSGHFDELTLRLAEINSHYPLHAVAIAKWLATTPVTFGSGISAMPSVHVAVAWFTFVVIRERLGGRHPLAYAGFAYFLLIWFGSVHLAWHYFTDGLLAVIAVSFLWWICGRYVSWVVGLPAKQGFDLRGWCDRLMPIRVKPRGV